MKPATIEQFELREKLQRLATDGVGGEAESARARLARLESRCDFSVAILRAGDIFTDAAAVLPNRMDCHPVGIALRVDEPHASFVKWAIDEGFKIESRWRTRPDGTGELCACVLARSIPNVAKAAAHIAESFGALWKTFRALPGATDADCRSFMLGLYDGMIGTARKAGEKLPPKAAQTVKAKKGRKKAVAIAPGLSIHPYEVAVPLGERVRMSAPLADLEHELQDAEARARITNAETQTQK
mgnify:CR=1 FL=1